MLATVEIDGDLLKVKVPYQAVRTREYLRGLGGKWVAEGKYWVVPAEFQNEVESRLKKAFGGFNSGEASVRIRAVEEWHYTAGPFGLGRQLIEWYQEKGGRVRPGWGVAIVSGRPYVGGSRNHPALIVPEGTLLRVTGVNLETCRQEDGTLSIPEGWEVVED